MNVKCILRQIVLLRIFFLISVKGNSENALVVIILNGFSHGYLEKPNMKSLRDNGFRGKMYPSVKESEPINYSIVTGLYPMQHGVVANHFHTKEGELSYKDAKTYSFSSHVHPIWEENPTRTFCVNMRGSEQKCVQSAKVSISQLLSTFYQ